MEVPIHDKLKSSGIEVDCDNDWIWLIRLMTQPMILYLFTYVEEKSLKYEVIYVPLSQLSGNIPVNQKDYMIHEGTRSQVKC